MTVLEIIEAETGQAVTGDTLLEELAVDSLEFLDLVLKIEEETGKDLDDERIPALKTVGDLIAELK